MKRRQRCPGEPLLQNQLLHLMLSCCISGSAIAPQAQPLHLNSLAKVCITDAKLLYGDGGAGEAARRGCQ